MPDSISDVARRLAEQAEAVCRHYLSNGRREGRYWLVGDVHNTPGRSLYVRLRGSESDQRKAGRWTDSATLEHGDLLDLIAAACGLDGIGEALDEARRFLGLARSAAPSLSPSSVQPATRFPSADIPATDAAGTALASVPTGSAEAARRLFRMSRQIAGTLASTYLRQRGIDVTPDMAALRFHPRCWYRPEANSSDGARDAWPALIAAVTDHDGVVTGVHRTWLDLSGRTKAPVAVPRRAMGHLLGHAVRFRPACDVLAAGEGIETMLSLRKVLPDLPLAAALSAAHLAGMLVPPGLRRLYIVRDNDAAGRRASATLTARAQAEGVEAMTLAPVLKDFNDDLQQRGPALLAASIRSQLAPEDVTRFWQPPNEDGRTCQICGHGGLRTLPSARLDPG
jgi:Toprim domain